MCVLLLSLFRVLLHDVMHVLMFDFAWSRPPCDRCCGRPAPSGTREERGRTTQEDNDAVGTVIHTYLIPTFLRALSDVSLCVPCVWLSSVRWFLLSYSQWCLLSVSQWRRRNETNHRTILLRNQSEQKPTHQNTTQTIGKKQGTKASAARGTCVESLVE